MTHKTYAPRSRACRSATTIPRTPPGSTSPTCRDKIPVHQGFALLVAPLRLVGATGPPVRMFARWEVV
jgi:hypothetical protein